jgi:lipopolysaccharide biosynthesis glycosyltransferase
MAQQPIVFARFLIPDLLPPEIDRVIYLDQDVLVLKDLTALWEINMDGYPIAAARACLSRGTRVRSGRRADSVRRTLSTECSGALTSGSSSLKAL